MYPYHRVLSSEEERVLFERINAGDDEARRIVIMQNLRLVARIARKYHSKSLTLEDRIQEGLIGLIHALGKFEPHKEYKFSTYATHWIRQAIVKAIKDTDRTIRFPTHAWPIAATLGTLEITLHDTLGRTPTDEELLEALPVTLEASLETVKAVRCVGVEASTDHLTSPDQRLLEMLQDDTAVCPEAYTLAHDQRTTLRRLLGVLDEKTRYVVERRFGLNGYSTMSLKELAQELRMSREGVRQIEYRALKKLKSIANGTEL